MINHPTFAMRLPQVKPDAMTASCFQVQDSKIRYKYLKNEDLTHYFSIFQPLGYNFLSSIKGRMIASLKLYGSHGVRRFSL